MEDMPIDDFSSEINDTKLKVKEFFLNENDGLMDLLN